MTSSAAVPSRPQAEWTLVTVTHNSSDHLRACWHPRSLRGFRWIVVDNASKDESARVAERLGADVIRLQENRGFSAANNVAMKEVVTDWVAFVNPDVALPVRLGLSRLAAVSRVNGALVSPQLLNPDGTEQPNARGFPFLPDKMANRSPLPIPGAQLDTYVRGGLTSPTFAAWTMGAALGGPTELFRQIGGWDERFFLYYEDHDLGLRAWRAGVPVVLDPVVRWPHQWQRATMRPRLAPWRHEIRSGRQFYNKYPELLSRRRFEKRGGFTALCQSLWRPAVDPDSPTRDPA